MMNQPLNTTGMELNQLQTALDRIVRKIGLEKTAWLLENFHQNSNPETLNLEKKKRVVQFLISEAIKVFYLEEKSFYTSEILEYREARMLCFYLLHQYNHTSYAKIGELFHRNKRSILYFCQKFREYLPIYDSYPELMEKYHQLEKSLLNFIASMNDTHGKID